MERRPSGSVARSETQETLEWQFLAWRLAADTCIGNSSNNFDHTTTTTTTINSNNNNNNNNNNNSNNINDKTRITNPVALTESVISLAMPIHLLPLPPWLGDS